MSDLLPTTAPSVHKLVDDRRVHNLMFGRFRSNAALAREVGIDQSTFRKKLQGIKPWYLHEVIELARALGTTVAYLTGETDSPEVKKMVAEAGHDPATSRL